MTYGATRAEHGWNHSLATLADCLTMASAFEGPLRTLPVIQALSTPAGSWSTVKPSPEEARDSAFSVRRGAVVSAAAASARPAPKDRPAAIDTAATRVAGVPGSQ